MTGGTVAASARTRSEIESGACVVPAAGAPPARHRGAGSSIELLSRPRSSTPCPLPIPVLEKPEWPAEFPLLPRDFQRYDETPDSKFYASPRFVTHIDDKAIKALTEWYRQHLPVSGLRDSAVLGESRAPRPSRAAILRARRRLDETECANAPEWKILGRSARVGSVVVLWLLPYPRPRVHCAAPPRPADMCSSWVSHYPMGYKAGRVVGLGMNEEELARNPGDAERRLWF